MSKILVPPFELEYHHEDRIKVLWNEGACERSLTDFKNLHHQLASTEKTFLLPNPKLIKDEQVLDWFQRLVQYNQEILGHDLLRRFLVDKVFHSPAKASFGLKSITRWISQVESLVTSKNKFDGYFS